MRRLDLAVAVAVVNCVIITAVTSTVFFDTRQLRLDGHDCCTAWKSRHARHS
jgi:hypothetical protein